MLEKKTFVDRVEIEMSTGLIFVRCQKTVMDGEKVLFREPHRTVIQPGINPDTVMSSVNTHLSELGAAAVSAEDIQRIKTFVNLVHTPETIQKFAADRAAADVAIVKGR